MATWYGLRDAVVEKAGDVTGALLQAAGASDRVASVVADHTKREVKDYIEDTAINTVGEYADKVAPVAAQAASNKVDAVTEAASEVATRGITRVDDFSGSYLEWPQEKWDAYFTQLQTGADIARAGASEWYNQVHGEWVQPVTSVIAETAADVLSGGMEAAKDWISSNAVDEAAERAAWFALNLWNAGEEIGKGAINLGETVLAVGDVAAEAITVGTLGGLAMGSSLGGTAAGKYLEFSAEGARHLATGFELLGEGFMDASEFAPEDSLADATSIGNMLTNYAGNLRATADQLDADGAVIIRESEGLHNLLQGLGVARVEEGGNAYDAVLNFGKQAEELSNAGGNIKDFTAYAILGVVFFEL